MLTHVQTLPVITMPILLVPEPRCTGKCCEQFFIYYSYREIFDPKRNFVDGEIIRDMLIPLYWEASGSDPEIGYAYTCKHHLPNGDCAIYPNRPRMCRDYPYGGVCEFAGCTYGHYSQRIKQVQRRNGGLLRGIVEEVKAE